MSISQSALKSWSVDRLKLELQNRTVQLDRLERQKEEMEYEYERNRTDNPTYWVHGEGAEAGVAPDFGRMNLLLSSVESEISEIQNELRHRIS
jgi:hypothetical protein